MAGTPGRDFISKARAALLLRAEVNEAIGLFGGATSLILLLLPLVPLNIKKGTSEEVPFFIMAGTTRLELATSCVTGMRSNQLSYAPMSIVFNYQNWFVGQLV